MPSFIKGGAVAGSRTQAVIDLTGGAAIAAGDLLIWEVVHSQGDASGQLTPASGTRLTAANGLLPGAASAHWAGFEVLDGTETTINMDMNFAAGTGSAVGWQVWRDAAETTFTLDSNFWEVGSASASTTMETPAFDVPAGGTAIAMFSNDGGADEQYTLAAMTERFNGHGLTGTFLNATGYSEDFASQQTDITRTATFPSSQNHAAFVFVITPTGPPATPGVIPSFANFPVKKPLLPGVVA